MPIRKPKPTSPGRRFITYRGLRGDHEDRAREVASSRVSRSPAAATRYGRKTARHRGGGAKRLYRKIDFKRTKDGVPAKVAAIEYDPNRTAYIALLHYVDGDEGLHPRPEPAARRHDGASRAPARTSRSATRCRWPSMPVGTIVHNVELQPGPRRASWPAPPASASS